MEKKRKGKWVEKDLWRKDCQERIVIRGREGREERREGERRRKVEGVREKENGKKNYYEEERKEK